MGHAVRRVFVAAGAIALLGGGVALADDPPPRILPGSLLVGLDGDWSGNPELLMAIETISQGRVEWRARHIPGLIRVKMPPGGEREIARTIALLPGVRYAHEDFLGHLDQTTPPCGVVPNDTYFTQQWGLRNTGQTVNGITGTYGADARAVEGWEALTDAPDVIIAVLDSGVNYDHADLAANIWTNPGEIPGNNIDDDNNGVVDDVHGAAFDEYLGDSTCEDFGRTADGDPWDARSFSYPAKISTEGGGHGSTAAAMAGAVGDNSTQLCGVAHGAKIMPLRVTNCAPAQATSWVVQAVDYALDKEAKILNCSFGLMDSQALHDAFTKTEEADMLLVTTAGNGTINLDTAPPSTPQYPALYKLSNMVVVSGSDQADRPELQLRALHRTPVRAGCEYSCPRQQQWLGRQLHGRNLLCGADGRRRRGPVLPGRDCDHRPGHG